MIFKACQCDREGERLQSLVGSVAGGECGGGNECGGGGECGSGCEQLQSLMGSVAGGEWLPRMAALPFQLLPL